MKRVYWRPQKVSRLALLLIGLLAVGGTLAIEWFPVERPAPDPKTKLLAAQLADRGIRAIGEARRAKGHTFDERFDPAGTGMIGTAMSPVTSLPAHLDSKQTSVNPNFAAAVVDMLREAGVEKGDVVAVGCTGSLPALNLAACTALEAVGAQPIIIHSAASSQFGANVPDMMWLDMERVLYDQGIVSFRSHAATLGGFGDRGRGMSAEARGLLRASLDRNHVPLLQVSSLAQSIDQRVQTYAHVAAGRPIKAYVNVGGGAASIHGEDGREAFGPGLSPKAPTENDIDCVAYRFSQQGVPVINLSGVNRLAESYGLPVAPQYLPEVGTGAVFATTRPSRLLAGLLLVTVLAIVRGCVWTDLGVRLQSRLQALVSRQAPELRVASASQAELMV